MRFGKKTNKKWYAYPKFGSWYRLDDGYLLFEPMNENEKRIDKVWNDNDEGGEVDWDLMEGEWATPTEKATDILEKIGYELSAKE